MSVTRPQNALASPLRVTGWTGSGLGLHNASSWKAGVWKHAQGLCFLSSAASSRWAHLGTSSAPPQILPHALNICSSPPLHCETLPPPKCCLLLPLRTSTVVSPRPGFPFLPIPLPVSSCSEKIQNRKGHKQFLPFRCYSTRRSIGKSLSIPL